MDLLNLLKDYFEFVYEAEQEDYSGRYDIDQITKAFMNENREKINEFNVATVKERNLLIDFLTWIPQNRVRDIHWLPRRETLVDDYLKNK